MISALKLLLNPTALGAILLSAVIAGGTGYVKGRVDGRDRVIAKLQADRIKVLKDGQEIDTKVLTADDTALCDFLGGCAGGVSDDSGD